MSKSTDYEALTYRAYLQSMIDALAAQPATASLGGSQPSSGMGQALTPSTPPTTLAGLGNGLSFKWNEWAPGYGEQCADTDGLAGLDNAVRLAQCQQDLAELRAECTKLVERCVQAEVNLAYANQERDALHTELAQRMAIPARALRGGV